MKEAELNSGVFPSAEDDVSAAELSVRSAQTQSPSYKLAYIDEEFLLRDELRPVRLQLELLKPELLQAELGIKSTVVVFGSTRIPDEVSAKANLLMAEKKLLAAPDNQQLQRQVAIEKSILQKCHYYEEARSLARLIAQYTNQHRSGEFVVITGGGPGIMEAANRGAHEEGAKTIGLNIVLPREQCPNPYVSPELCFQFHYFALRKMHFLKRAKALLAFPGGYGTMDELFEALTLLQTKKIKPMPILLFGESYWRKIINFDAMVDEGVISLSDLNLFEFVDTADSAWGRIREFYKLD